MYLDIDESDIKEIIDEQIRKFIDEAYYTYPKEYRQSDEYRGLSIDEKFKSALNRLGLDRFKELMSDEIINTFL